MSFSLQQLLIPLYLLSASISLTLSRPSPLSPSAFSPYPVSPLTPPLPLSSCSPTITQTEASLSAVFLAGLEDPPHNQTGAKLILPSPSPDWTNPGQTNTKYYISYVRMKQFSRAAPLVCNGQLKSTPVRHNIIHNT